MMQNNNNNSKLSIMNCSRKGSKRFEPLRVHSNDESKKSKPYQNDYFDEDGEDFDAAQIIKQKQQQQQ